MIISFALGRIEPIEHIEYPDYPGLSPAVAVSGPTGKRAVLRARQTVVSRLPRW